MPTHRAAACKTKIPADPGGPATLDLTDCTIGGSKGHGTGVDNYFATLHATGCTISGSSIGALFAFSGATTLTGCKISGEVTDPGSNPALIDAAQGTLTMSKCTVNGTAVASAIAVVVTDGAGATINDSTLTAHTGILMGKNSNDNSTLSAHENDLADDVVGVQNIQTSIPISDLQQIPVDAIHNWWGKSKGPNTPGAASAVGPVRHKPWLTARPRS
jgi:hypothetical protein